MDDEDNRSTRFALIAAGLLGGLFVFMYFAAFVTPASVPGAPAPVAQVVATEAPSIRLHTPTPDPRLSTPTPIARPVTISDREYKAQLAAHMEEIIFEINVINAGVHLADYRDRAWQSTMTDSAASLQRACNKLKSLDPPAHLAAVHDNVRNMADHFIRGAQIVLKDYGHIDGQTLDAVAVQFSQGADDLELVAEYFDR